MSLCGLALFLSVLTAAPDMKSGENLANFASTPARERFAGFITLVVGIGFPGIFWAYGMIWEFPDRRPKNPKASTGVGFGIPHCCAKGDRND